MNDNTRYSHRRTVFGNINWTWRRKYLSKVSGQQPVGQRVPSDARQRDLVRPSVKSELNIVIKQRYNWNITASLEALFCEESGFREPAPNSYITLRNAQDQIATEI